MLATQLKDMGIEELLGLIGPVLYLLPLALVAMLATFFIGWVRSLAPKFMLSYMETEGLTEAQKQEYLAKYLSRQSMRDCRRGRKNCPVCGKNYAVKTMVTNARGDVVEQWLDTGCPYCRTKVCTTAEENSRKYYFIERSRTDSPKEEKYQELFAKLNGYIEFYKPYTDTSCSSDDGDGNIRVDVYIH